jgi:hypothetical protein
VEFDVCSGNCVGPVVVLPESSTAHRMEVPQHGLLVHTLITFDQTSDQTSNSAKAPVDMHRGK